VTTEQDCQVRCNTHRDFVCRSYSFYAAASQCFISGDDKGKYFINCYLKVHGNFHIFKLQKLASALEEAIQKRPGTTYYERNCKGTTLGPLPPSVPGIPDRPFPGPFGNGIADDRPRQGVTDHQSETPSI
jgi:hypothetical protein